MEYSKVPGQALEILRIAVSNTRKFRRRVKYPDIECLNLEERVQAFGVFKDILLKDPNWEHLGSGVFRRIRASPDLI